MIRRRAFTLLELLLATVLMTMLMVGVLAVIGGMARTSAAIASTSTSQANEQARINVPDELISAMLREDLAGADRVRADGSERLVIEGQIGLADVTLASTHRPAKVTYRIVKVGGRRWLVRTQRMLDVLDNQSTRHDLVCADIGQIVLTAVEPRTDDPAAVVPSEPLPSLVVSAEPAAGVVQSTPTRDEKRYAAAMAWHVQVWATDSEQPERQRMVVLR